MSLSFPAADTAAAMTPAEMQRILAEHGGYEIILELDKTMATVSDNPVYEYSMAGYRAEGREAVREAYRRQFERYMCHIDRGEVRTVSFGPAHMVIESYIHMRMAGGVTRAGRSLTIVTFEDGRVSGERIYPDPFIADYWRTALGDDFREVPGVTLL